MKTQDLKDLKADLLKRKLLDAKVKELKAQIAQIDLKIQEKMGDAELGYADDFEVKWTKTESNRFDSTAFKADHPDIYESYCAKQESRRFSVNQKKPKKGVSFHGC